MRKKTILLVRINCAIELANTSAAVDDLKHKYPDYDFETISSASSEGIEFLRSDSRIKTVHIVEAHGKTVLSKLFALFEGIKSIGKPQASIVFYGSTYGLIYHKHVLASVFLPGKRYLLGADNVLIPTASVRGMKMVAGVLLQATLAKTADKVLLLRFPRRPSKEAANAQLLSPGSKVLVIRLDSIGDVVATMPIAQAVSRQVGRPVDILMRDHIHSLVSTLPFVRTVHTYNHVNIQPDDRATIDLIKQIRHEKYDMVLELTGNSSTARLFGRLSGAPLVVGSVASYDGPRQQSEEYLDRPVHSYVGIGGYFERAVRLTKQLQIDHLLEPCFFNVSEERASTTRSLLDTLGVRNRYTVVHLRGSTEFKAWKPASVALVCDYLIKQHNMDIVLTGASYDYEVNEEHRLLSKETGRIFNLAGKFEVESLPSLFEGSKLVVSVDTGPAHLASACHCNLIVLGLPENAPYNSETMLLAATSDFSDTAGHYRLHSISIEAVIEAVEEKLQSNVHI